MTPSTAVRRQLTAPLIVLVASAILAASCSLNSDDVEVFPSVTTQSAPSSEAPLAAPLQTPTSTTTTPPTTAPPTTAPPVEIESNSFSFSVAPGGWVLPQESDLGAVMPLHPFVEANDGEFGVTIDADFLEANAGAQWLSVDDGQVTISQIDATNLCLNITVPLTLRDSYVSCPSREQPDSWGYAGVVDDAPAINILAPDVVIERNTIVCTGNDRFICSRSVRVNAERATIWLNDLSGARGAVQLFTDAFFGYNHVHDLTFGFDPSRVNNPSDNVTHNNATNNQGYSGTVVRGNYIEATYGRVSTDPESFRNPHFRDAYADGIVEVGDPLNGFVFANYLHNGNGNATIIERNFVIGAGRGFRCNASSTHEDAVCAESLRFNVFAEDQLGLFAGEPRFEDQDENGVLNASCNFTLEGLQFLPVAPADDPSCDGWNSPDTTRSVVVDDLLAFARRATPDAAASAE